jgi:alkanesulfonate monooxygenase SsuD/methylene tetrahydromethanopterin reductase-like flavin-dependent oxidoreductase (luciferase family)
MAEAGPMTTGALFLMPFYHPVLLAEQVGTLACLAEGPFVMIAAAGYGEREFAAFGQSMKTRPSRMEEHLTIVRRLLAGESVSMAGRYHRLTDVSINPIPPEPVAIWIAASARPAVERAGTMGDAWLAAPGATGEELTTAADIYRQAAARAGRAPVLAIRRDVYVGESDAEAEEATAPLLARGYRGIHRSALIIGGPERVTEELHALHGQGFSHVLIRHIVPQQELVLASYRRLGEHVLPKVREWSRSQL